MKFEELKKENGTLTYVRFNISDAIRPGIYSMVTMDSFSVDKTIQLSDFSIPYLKANVK
jgi:hypothetical protein